jgi:hypothetical protein
LIGKWVAAIAALGNHIGSPLNAKRRQEDTGMAINGRPAPARERRIAAAMLAAAAGLLVAADAPTGGERGVYAFVLSNIYIANGGEADICPVPADGGLESFFHMLPPEEQAKYATPDKRPALEQLMNKHFGFRRVALRGGDRGGRVEKAVLPPGFDPDSAVTPELALEIGRLNNFPKGRGRLAYQKQTVAYSACTNPEDFPMLAKGFRTFEGKVATGINLDGKIRKADFSGTDGAAGVDNQLWRAMGCVKPFRENSDPKLAKKTFISARAPTIMELRGVNDLDNDPDVTVNIYAAADPVTRNARGDALARASFALDPDPALRATTRGRIANGELIAEPVDLRLNYKEQILDAPRHIRGTRIRARLKPDGSIEGGLYGYYTLASFYDSIEQMTQNGANLTGVSCPGVRQAIDRLADGYKDPATGRFTAISSAYHFFGVRAFVIAPETAGPESGS